LLGYEVWRYLAAAVTGVQFIEEPFCSIHERIRFINSTPIFFPIGGVEIFNHVEAILRKLRVQKIECRIDVVHLMASIVKYHIGNTEFVNHRLQKSLITLIADANEDARPFITLAVLLNVNSDNPRHRTKEALPHCDGTASRNAYLEEGQRFVAPRSKVTLIDGKIMDPLVNHALIIRNKILPQIHEISLRQRDRLSWEEGCRQWV
jgi:hypothetical protein